MIQKRITSNMRIFIGGAGICFCSQGLISGTAALYLPYIAEDLNLTYTQMSGALMLTTIIMSVALPVTIRLLRRFDRRWIIVICAVMDAVSWIVRAGSQSLIGFTLSCALLGIGHGMITGAIQGILITHYFNTRRGIMLGLSSAAGGIGAAIFSPILRLIIAQAGWRTTMAFSAVIMLAVNVAITLAIMRDDSADKSVPVITRPGPEYPETKGRALIRSVPFFLFQISVIVLVFPASGVTQYFATYALSVGQTARVGATIISLYMIGSAVGRVSLGYLMDTIKPAKAITLFSFAGLAGFAGLIIFREPVILSACAVLIGVFCGISMVGVSYVCSYVFGSENYAYLASVTSVFITLSNALTTLLVGAMYDMRGDFMLVLALSMAFTLVGCGTMLKLLYGQCSSSE